MSTYAQNKAWRLKNPKQRAINARRWYNKHRYKEMRYRRYEPADIGLIITKRLNGKYMTDAQIAKYLGRAVSSIQVQRSNRKKEKA